MKPDLWTSNTESAWRRKIGMSTKDDHRPPQERNVFLRRLRNLVEQRMLHFLKDEKPDLETLAEREAIWTPIPWICHNLEISHAHLSRLFRELLGLNVIQFYDKLKLTETGTILTYIALIREFVAAQFPIPHPLTPIPYAGNGAKHFWKWLKTQRKNPDFDRQALAKEFGFPSAARLHCAFNSATNHTPREFENLVIRFALDDVPALEALIAHFTPKPVTLESLGITQLHPEQLFSPEKPQDLEFPIVLHTPPAQPADSKVIDAVFTVLDHHKQLSRKPPGSDEATKDEVK